MKKLYLKLLYKDREALFNVAVLFYSESNESSKWLER